MPKAAQGGGFFVVGGLVQSDRPCYIERAADGELLSELAEQRFCYVLGPRAIGKSSLMARTIRRLRADGQLASLVDLSQIAARGGDALDAGRWYYNIAYRIVRDLRLKVDLQTWWQRKSGLLGNQRLVEFFGEIVLANTAPPVTIFIDEADRALELSFSAELFTTIRSCYLQRVTEPDHARLNFVVLGVATPAQLCPNAGASPFVDGVAIEIEDFSLAECQALGAGFGTDATTSRALIERIHEWTDGHPYLTQKIARGVARRGGKLADVERVVQEQFLAAAAAADEPLLSDMRGELARKRPETKYALARLDKLANGVEVKQDARGPREYLRLVGLVKATDRKLEFRNRIFARVFGADRVRDERPANWRLPAAAAAAAAVIVLLSYWYTQVLPRPYINTLSVVTQDYAVAENAYRRLRRLPGFRATADDLLAAVMERRSYAATSIGEVAAADAVIRGELGMEERASRALARYWLRQSVAATHRGDRDTALLYAVESVRDAPEIGAGAAVALIGTDYARLERTFRLPQAPMRWGVDWERNEIIVVDPARRLERLPFGAHDAAPAGGPAQGVGLDRLTALQHVPVARELVVDAVRIAGAFDLLLDVEHARASDLFLTLTAPSGARATLVVPQRRDGQHELTFSARGASELAELADEQALGTWQLTLVDRRSEEAGSLASWGLRFPWAETPWVDVPEQGVSLPDPFRSEQVDIALGDGARLATAHPLRQSGGGALAVWDLRQGVLIGDLRIAGAPEHVVLSAAAERVLAVSGNEATIWDIRREEPIWQSTAPDGFALPPILSGDGRIAALAETVAGGSPRFTVLRVDTGERIATFDGVAAPHDWVLDAEGRVLVVLDAADRAFVFDARAGVLRTQLRHPRGFARVVPAAGDTSFVTVDLDGDMHGWRLEQSQSAFAVADRWLIGVTADPSSVSGAALAETLVRSLGDGLVAVQDARGARQPQYLRAGNSAVVATSLSPDAGRLVTVDGSLVRLWQVEVGPSLTSVDTDLSAVALDAGGDMAALGFRGGHVRVVRVAALEGAAHRADSVDYIGHRGAVTSLAINAAHNLVASGGVDGVVRIWNMTTVAPTERLLRHPAGPIEALVQTPDGERTVSAAGFSARVWATRSGELLREIPVDGTATAVAVSADASLVAVGDTNGNIFYGAIGGPAALGAVRAEGSVTALAVSADAARIVSGDVAGNLILWDTAGRGERVAGHEFSAPVEWARFGADPDTLLVRSGAWAHLLVLGSGGLEVEASELMPMSLGPSPVAAVLGDGTVRWHAGAAAGVPAFVDLDLGTAPDPPEPATALLERDWPEILGLRLDRDAGTPRIVR